LFLLTINISTDFNHSTSTMRKPSIKKLPTEPRGRVFKPPASYSGVSGFESCTGDRPLWLSFLVDFLSPSRQMTE
jgi:hypothetical protein